MRRTPEAARLIPNGRGEALSLRFCEESQIEQKFDQAPITQKQLVIKTIN